jgi:hypothetical protein
MLLAEASNKIFIIKIAQNLRAENFIWHFATDP